MSKDFLELQTKYETENEYNKTNYFKLKTKKYRHKTLYI